jgi:hypothetical protein
LLVIAEFGNEMGRAVEQRFALDGQAGRVVRPVERVVDARAASVGH